MAKRPFLAENPHHWWLNRAVADRSQQSKEEVVGLQRQQAACRRSREQWR
jgi:hypothetical protein